MIQVHRLNGTEMAVNADLVETVEATPDTVITLATGNRLVVRESVAVVIGKITEYKKALHAGKSVVNPIQGFERK